jgi:hypothetical protein
LAIGKESLYVFQDKKIPCTVTGTDGDFDINFKPEHFEADSYAPHGFDIKIQLVGTNLVETKTIVGTKMFFKTTFALDTDKSE